jgi:hypothetical protein
MKNENALPKLGLHKFITIALLPLTIAVSIYVAIGNVFSIGRVELTSISGYIDALILMLPFVTAILFTVSLVGLLGLTHFGRRSILFSTTFLTIMLILIIFGKLLAGRVYYALIFTAVAFIYMLIYAYYRRRDYYFVKDGQSLGDAKALQKSTETKPDTPEVKEEAPLAEEKAPEVKPEEGHHCCHHDENEGEHHCCHHDENEGEHHCCHHDEGEEHHCCHEENKDEEPSVGCCCCGGNENTEEENEGCGGCSGSEEEKNNENIELNFSDAAGSYSTDDIQKKAKFIYAEDRTNRNDVILLSSSLTVLKDRTVIELEVENRGDKEYTSSDWTFMKDVHYRVDKTIAPGKTVLTLSVDKPVDRMSVELNGVN